MIFSVKLHAKKLGIMFTSKNIYRIDFAAYDNNKKASMTKNFQSIQRSFCDCPIMKYLPTLILNIMDLYVSKMFKDYIIARMGVRKYTHIISQAAIQLAFNRYIANVKMGYYTKSINVFAERIDTFFIDQQLWEIIDENNPFLSGKNHTNTPWNCLCQMCFDKLCNLPLIDAKKLLSINPISSVSSFIDKTQNLLEEIKSSKERRKIAVPLAKLTELILGSKSVITEYKQLFEIIKYKFGKDWIEQNVKPKYKPIDILCEIVTKELNTW